MASLRLFESVCLKCKCIYAVKIGLCSRDDADAHITYGLCESCSKKLKEEKIGQKNEDLTEDVI